MAVRDDDLLAQATIAEMVRDEEEDAMRSAAVPSKGAPGADPPHVSFTSEDDEDAPSRAKGRRRRREEPGRQRAGAPGRHSRPGSTTASPIKVGGWLWQLSHNQDMHMVSRQRLWSHHVPLKIIRSFTSCRCTNCRCIT